MAEVTALIDHTARENLEELWSVGVVLACCSTLVSVLGKQFLRLAAMKEQNLFNSNKTVLDTYSTNLPPQVIKSPTWVFYLVGVSFTVAVAPLLQLYSSAFAAQPILSALLALVFVWNILLAPVCMLALRPR